MAEEGLELLRWLPGLVARRDEGGGYRYSELEVLDFVAVFLVELGVHPGRLPREFVALLGDFARRAGVPLDASADETKAAILRYLEAHPLNPELTFELQRGLREGLAIPRDEDIGAAFHRFMGAGVRPIGSLIAKAPAPAGAIAGGPLARFMALKATGGGR